jgi:hypothetical protein
LLEKGARIFPLFLQDYVDRNIEYGLSSEETCIDVLVKDWPIGITLFPGKQNLRAIVPMNKAPGLDLHQLSKIDMFRILVERDIKALPQGGFETVSPT